MARPIQVLHVIQQLSRGGAARSLVATAASAATGGASTHRILSLCPVDARARSLADAAHLPLVEAPSRRTIEDDVRAADIVHVHFWNSPELLAFMRDLDVPARVILWSHVPGDTPPQLLRPVLDWADVTIASSPSSLNVDGMILDTPDFSRLQPVVSAPRRTFNVGYVGTVDPVKMHTDFVAMSAAVNIPDVRYIVFGSGNGFGRLREEAARRGVADRFEFGGYVEDVARLYATFDVFGYPVTHCSADLVLQEAMYAGVPPVVFDTGGARSLVRDGETGLVVASADAYVAAIEALYSRPDERLRLAANAASHARRMFGPDRAAAAFAEWYERLMAGPKRRRSPLFARATPREVPTGAQLFTQMLGDAAGPFRVSLTSTIADELLDAEAVIALSSPMIVDAGGGGVLHYRRHDPDDPHLRLWSGLVLGAHGRPALAVSEFEAARRLGLNHWRVSWYIADTARAAGAPQLALDSLARVVRDAPAFARGREALASLEGLP